MPIIWCMITRKQIVEMIGSGALLAKYAGVSRQAIHEWKHSDKPIPAERVLAIEAATDYQVSRHDLRPDLYPKEAWCQCPACLREREEAA